MRWCDRPFATVVVLGLGQALGGCNAILGIDDVTVLCEVGSECPSGFCRPDFTCDDQQWTVPIGADGRSEAMDVVVVDPDGDGPRPAAIVVVGSFEGTMTLGDGVSVRSEDGLDAYVMAVDRQGQTLWSQVFTGPGDQRAVAVAANDEVIYVAGDLGAQADFGVTRLSAGDAGAAGFVAALDPDGDPRWAQGFGGTQSLTVGDLLVSQGAPVVLGSYRGGWASPPGAVDTLGFESGLLVVYDAQGSLGASQQIPSSQDLRICCGRVDPLTDALVLGGDFTGRISAGGMSLDSIDGRDGFVLVSSRDQNGQQAITSLSATLDPLVAFNTDSLARLAWGVVGSEIFAVPAISILRRAPDGNFLAVRGNSPSGTATIGALVHNRVNDTIAVGTFEDELEFTNGTSYTAAGSDLFVVTIDDTWELVDDRSMTFTGGGDVTAGSVIVDDDGHVIVVGTFDGTLEIRNATGERILEAVGTSDAFVTRLQLEDG